ncbi:FeoB-associated Cys-rich membrane protein [Paenibacillus caui]|uniref:FeoB-associated Cys-rich membrane protein n=1 Tax=Paenibacillus caui TaxID=2873927 RepID=UPI001CA8DEC1|nr:FeoB-associated Cys-rich membrane protein [Paenibacillus caui]
MIGIGITLVIFAYAGWTLYRFFKKSKKGACAGCSHSKACTAACCAPPEGSKKAPL